MGHCKAKFHHLVCLCKIQRKAAANAKVFSTNTVICFNNCFIQTKVKVRLIGSKHKRINPSFMCSTIENDNLASEDSHASISTISCSSTVLVIVIPFN